MDPFFRPTLLLSIATVRQPGAVEFLLSLIETERAPAAVDAVKALELYRRDEQIRVRVAELVERRKSDALRKAYATAFPA